MSFFRTLLVSVSTPNSSGLSKRRLRGWCIVHLLILFFANQFPDELPCQLIVLFRYTRSDIQRSQQQIRQEEYERLPASGNPRERNGHPVFSFGCCQHTKEVLCGFKKRVVCGRPAKGTLYLIFQMKMGWFRKFGLLLCHHDAGCRCG